VLCREIVRCHQFLTVFLQTHGSLGVFGFIGFYEKIKGFLSVRPRIGLIWVSGSVIRRFSYGIMSFLLIRKCTLDIIVHFFAHADETAIATFLKTDMDVRCIGGVVCPKE
jgi:hypothetical protein